MSVAANCPRCGGPVRPPGLMHSEWRCDLHGAVLPLRLLQRIDAAVLASVPPRIRVPLWCLWPLLPGWTVTGVGWVGDEREPGRAAVLALSGPAPLQGGPADVVLVAEEPGVGLGCRYAGLDAPDPGPRLAETMRGAPHAKVTAAGHPTPLWSVDAPPDRSVYVGEARGVWLYAVAWPASAGYLLAEEVVLHDLTDSLPSALVFGARSPYLHGET